HLQCCHRLEVLTEQRVLHIDAHVFLATCHQHERLLPGAESQNAAGMPVLRDPLAVHAGRPDLP
ncbi:hypothetical protein, partial [Vibrio anguillarum]|uniref:hypothetical protein n=1 Tax=Vibrio anguillarum TaxID=55601 RepID=UPI00188D23B0